MKLGNKIKLSIIGCSLMFLSSLSMASTEPSMTYNSSTYTHTLNPGAGIEKAFNAYRTKNNKGEMRLLPETQFLNIIREVHYNDNMIAPNAAIGDFNGDGKKDLVAFYQSMATREYFVMAFISQKKAGEYTAHSVISWEESEFKDDCIDSDGKIIINPHVVDKSRVSYTNERDKKLAGRDIFQIEAFMGHVDLIYFDGKIFKYSRGEVRVRNEAPES